ncbi:MAG TPA: hypothetical protein VHM20_06695 [Gammaproteobacteria bacterium]|nr:hypothetical protein [Gammaproteobacteria bacterium]
MLSKLDSYFNETKQFVFKHLGGKSSSKIALTDICCITILPTEVSIGFAHHNQNKTDLILCESYHYENIQQLPTILVNFIKKYDLKHIRTSLILQPDDYQLLVTDALPVSPAEFQAAIRFKIKDLLHYPINDVVIDNFPIPKIKADSPAKIMIVASQTSKLIKVTELIRHAGFNLNIIDIPELALRNITALFEKDNQSAVLIYVQEKSIELLITSQKEIYIVRKLMFSLGQTSQNVEVSEQEVERLASEIQRSFGYYQSQWRQPAPANVIFASTKTFKTDILSLLSQQLKVPVQMINLSEYINMKKPLTDSEVAKYLTLIGGMLRAD